MSDRVSLLFEKDADYFIVTDDISVVYGIGDTQAEALFDYLESLIEYRALDEPLSRSLRNRVRALK